MSNVFVLGNAGVDLSLTLAHLVLPGETTVASDGVRAPGGKVALRVVMTSWWASSIVQLLAISMAMAGCSRGAGIGSLG